MKKLYTLLLYTVLTGCAALGATSVLTDALSPSDGVSVEAQVGKENTKQIVGQQNETTNDVGGDQNTVTVMNQNIPMWYILLLVLGWMLPSPSAIWEAVSRLFRGRYENSKR